MLHHSILFCLTFGFGIVFGLIGGIWYYTSIWGWILSKITNTLEDEQNAKEIAIILHAIVFTALVLSTICYYGK